MILKHLKLAAKDAGINLFLTNAEEKLDAQLRRLDLTDKKPTLMISWDINTSLNINQFGFLDNPSIDIVALLVTKPLDTSKDEAEKSAQEMGVLFQNYIQFLYSRVIKYQRTSENAITGASYKLVPIHSSSKHSGILGKFTMNGELEACPVAIAEEDIEQVFTPPVCKVVQMQSVFDEYMSTPVDDYISPSIKDLNIEFRYDELVLGGSDSIVFLDQSNYVATVLTDSVLLKYEASQLIFKIIKNEIEIINITIPLGAPIASTGIVAIKGTETTVNAYIDQKVIGSVAITDSVSPTFSNVLSELNFNAQIDGTDTIIFDLNPTTVDFMEVKVNNFVWDFEDYAAGKVFNNLTSLHSTNSTDDMSQDCE